MADFSYAGKESVVLDHLVYATPDLAMSVRDLGERLGVTPVEGGQHVGQGTRNYLVGLGSGSYLEIIGVDPQQPEPERARSFGLDTMREPRLVTWAVRVEGIEQRAEQARIAGYDPGLIHAMSRARPDGVLLEWKLTPSGSSPGIHPLPFLIEWGQTPHPSSSTAGQARLAEFFAESPDPEHSRLVLTALGVSLDVRQAREDALVATIVGPAGQVTLR